MPLKKRPLIVMLLILIIAAAGILIFAALNFRSDDKSSADIEPGKSEEERLAEYYGLDEPKKTWKWPDFDWGISFK